MIPRAFLFALPFLLLPHSAFGWGGAGHQVIAAEAYRELSPTLKPEVFAVLKAHPDFAKWTNAYHPNASFDLPAYVFMRSSTWPDEIRRTDSPYDHPVRGGCYGLCSWADAATRRAATQSNAI